MLYNLLVNNSKKIVIITGVTSFLGRSVAKKLLVSKFIVYGIVRPDSKRTRGLLSIKGLKLIKLDINKYTIGDFSKAIHIDTKGCDITFIHFAWGATLDRNNFIAQESNVEYSKKVLAFAKALGATRFIFAGSQAEMSTSAYGTAKKEFANEAERLLKDSRVDFIHMRIFSIYGKEDRDTSLLKTLVKSIKGNKDIELSTCEYKWNFLYIDDFTEMVYRLITKKVKTGTYDMASDDTRFLKDYVIEAHKVLKGKNKLLFGKREDSKEVFSLPEITHTLLSIGNMRYTKFSKGIKKLW